VNIHPSRVRRKHCGEDLPEEIHDLLGKLGEAYHALPIPERPADPEDLLKLEDRLLITRHRVPASAWRRALRSPAERARSQERLLGRLTEALTADPTARANRLGVQHG
jgi:hypothetical protein